MKNNILILLIIYFFSGIAQDSTKVDSVSTGGFNNSNPLRNKTKIRILAHSLFKEMDTNLISSVLLDPKEDLFTPTFFAVNSGLYKFPFLLNTEDYGWFSTNVMQTYDQLDFKYDSIPELKAKYDHGFPTTHWFTADFNRKIGASSLTAKFNRRASETLYTNTRSFRTNVLIGTEIPINKNYKLTLGYFRNQAEINENGGIKNIDSIPIVTEFNSLELFSNLNSAKNNIFNQKIHASQRLIFKESIDSITHQKSNWGLSLVTDFSENRMSFELNENDIDSGYFLNTFNDTLATFDSVGFKTVTVQPSIFIKNKSGGYNIGYNKKFNDFKGFNDAFAFLKGEFRLKKIPISYSTKYHLEGIWKSNWEVILRSNYYLRKETGDTVRSNKLLNLTFTSSAKNPEYIFHSFSGNHHQWENNFKPVSLNKANLELFFKSITTIVDVEIQNVSNYIYFDQNSLPQQTKKNITAGKIHVKNQFGKKIIRVYSGIGTQFSTSELIRIPMFFSRNTISLNFKYRSVPLTLGGTASYFSKYQGLNYNPSIRHYHLGDNMAGGTAVIDWFIAARLGPADLYVKFDNSFYTLNRNLFLGDNYPIYKSYVRFGLKWRLKN
ncbi:putative porin [Flavobacteriales bacterium]|nr:putative porin [Flavobacteriales bacterium]